MGNYSPAPNIIFAFAGGFIATILLHVAAAYGYVPNTDVSAALPAAIALAMAHLWDVITGDNKKS